MTKKTPINFYYSIFIAAPPFEYVGKNIYWTHRENASNESKKKTAQFWKETETSFEIYLPPPNYFKLKKQHCIKKLISFTVLSNFKIKSKRHRQLFR